MKKFLLWLIMPVILVTWSWQDFGAFGTKPAYGQPPPQVVCDPYYETCTYYNYYTAPYADPYSQYFYYTVPEVQEELRERRREHRERELRRELWEREHGFR